MAKELTNPIGEVDLLVVMTPTDAAIGEETGPAIGQEIENATDGQDPPMMRVGISQLLETVTVIRGMNAGEGDHATTTKTVSRIHTTAGRGMTTMTTTERRTANN